MTIPSAFANFGTGGKLASGDVNTLNTNVQMALDKRAGQTDTLASIISCTGAGRVVDSYAAGADAATTYLISGANSIINASGITALRTYTLSNAGAVAGDRVMILNPSSFQLIVQNAALAIIAQLGPTTAASGGGANGATSTWGDFLFNGSAWVLWRSAQPSAPTATTFTANGTWICPNGVTLAMLIGYGAGAGGAGGGSGTTSASGPCATGGGGGGGAMQIATLVAVSAGSSYAVVIGAGGAGGASDTDGTVGADTTFASLAIFSGAGSGIAGGVNSATAAAFGGGPIRLISNLTSNTRTLLDTQGIVQRVPGGGGAGRNDPNNVGITGLSGTGSLQGFAGGNGAVKGTTNGTANGGGGGGGGAGGPGGVGAAAGAGGAGGNSGTAAPGVAGSAAAANTGAGGGGGGGGGQCTAGGASVPGSGGTGGAGGSGQLIVIPIR
jgi:hypothetical protein